MKTLATMYRDQFRAVDDAVEDWKANHDEAMGVYELEQMISSCRELHDWTLRLVACKWNAGFAGNLRSPDRIGHVVLVLLQAGIKAWQSCAEGADSCTALGYGEQPEPRWTQTVSISEQKESGPVVR